MLVHPILRIRSPVIGRGEQIFELTGRAITLGRGEDCDVVLLEQAASRLHARIHPMPAGLVLEDAGSANGTWVAGQRVSEHVLRDGDVFRIGATEITLVLEPHRQPTLVEMRTSTEVDEAHAPTIMPRVAEPAPQVEPAPPPYVPAPPPYVPAPPPYVPAPPPYVPAPPPQVVPPPPPPYVAAPAPPPPAPMARAPTWLWSGRGPSPESPYGSSARDFPTRMGKVPTGTRFGAWIVLVVILLALVVIVVIALLDRLAAS